MANNTEMLRDTSLDQIKESLEIVDCFLQSSLLSAILVHQNRNSCFSLLTDLTTHQDTLEFESAADNARHFEEFLHQEMEKEAIIKASQTQRSKKKISKPIRYIQKNTSPKTIFNYCGVDIEVLFKKYDNFKGDTLVILYDSLNAQSISNQVNNTALAGKLLKRINCNKSSELICLNSRSFFQMKRYEWIYMFPRPEYKTIPEYSCARMSEMVESVVSNVVRYKTSNLVFKGFEWSGLESKTKCAIFYSFLMKSIWDRTRSERIKLAKISICCENKKMYFDFTEELRRIGDEYVRCGWIQC